MKLEHLREHVIRPTLKVMGHWSQSAENLLIGTAAQESHLGEYLVQINGPALGIFQMEPKTYYDIKNNYLDYRPELEKRVVLFAGKFSFDAARSRTRIEFPIPEEMIGNLYFATAMARVHYLRAPDALPDADDVVGLANYWKTAYNTWKGKGSTEEFIANYERFVV